jgi:hypothetical protein
MGPTNIGVIGTRLKGLPENYPHGQHESALGVCVSSSGQTDSTGGSDLSAATSTQHHATTPDRRYFSGIHGGAARRTSASAEHEIPLAHRQGTWRHELLDQRLGGGELTVKQYRQQRETLGDALPSPLGASTNSSRAPVSQRALPTPDVQARPIRSPGAYDYISRDVAAAAVEAGAPPHAPPLLDRRELRVIGDGGVLSRRVGVDPDHSRLWPQRVLHHELFATGILPADAERPSRRCRRRRRSTIPAAPGMSGIGGVIRLGLKAIRSSQSIVNPASRIAAWVSRAQWHPPESPRG